MSGSDAACSFTSPRIIFISSFVKLTQVKNFSVFQASQVLLLLFTLINTNQNYLFSLFLTSFISVLSFFQIQKTNIISRSCQSSFCVATKVFTTVFNILNASFYSLSSLLLLNLYISCFIQLEFSIGLLCCVYF